MLTTRFDYIPPASESEREYLESLIRAEYERCRPGDTLDYLKLRALGSPNDAGLLRDWMAVAATYAAGRMKAAHTVKRLDAIDPRVSSPDLPEAISGSEAIS